ncbi:MAG: sugar kinase [Abditibacteriales bacterium]|nr:sugar kinase [Abditibacteriales bacterium]MDW8367653.1 sugar kinase [Abditibacteriales bacterium]
MLDALGIGEVMLRLAAPRHARLEQADVLEVFPGGAELNVMATLAGLGCKTAWVSKLTNNPLGRRIARAARANNVDVSRVVWTDEGRIGLYFVEFGCGLRATDSYYDRQGSSINLLTPEELDWEFILNTRILHLTGITVALSDNCEQLVRTAIERAKAAGVTVSFDVNYRSKLWGVERARNTLEDILPQVDILINTNADNALLFGIAGDPEDAIRRTKERFGVQVAVLTLKNGGAIACADEVYSSQPVFTPEVLDRIGAGDAFTAGFLYGYLQGDLPRAVQIGSAMAALKHTLYGDHAPMRWEEIERIMAGTEGEIRR